MLSKWLHREQKLLRKKSIKNQSKPFSDSSKKSKKNKNRRREAQEKEYERLEYLFNYDKNNG